MMCIRGLLALLGLAALSAEVRAQVVVVPNPYIGNGVFFTPSRRSSVAISIGFPGYYPAYAIPYSATISQVTVVYPAPPVQPAPPTVVAVVPQRRILRLDDLGTLDPELRPEPVVKPKPPPEPEAAPPLPGGKDAGVFRPLGPDNRDRAARPVPQPQPEKLPPPPPFPPPDLPRPMPPEADPKAEAERQLKLGREAFAGRTYGRSVQRFRDAVRANPNDAMAQFLLAQALFATGRYAEAVEAIRTGVTLRPDWPNARFAPRDLYGANAADFADHLRRLREALDLLPDDPVLLFLYGYELWFDGREAEARPLFRKARPRMVDPAVIDRFLALRPVL